MKKYTAWDWRKTGTPAEEAKKLGLSFVFGAVFFGVVALGILILGAIFSPDDPEPHQPPTKCYHNGLEVPCSR